MIFLKRQKPIKIYLDYAASTPVSKRVFSIMKPYFSEHFANPSSVHILGQRTHAAIDKARDDVAVILSADWKEIIFTPSATASINLALRGVIKGIKKEIKNPHIVTTNIEHSAVLKTCKDLEKDGVEVTYLSVNEKGLIFADQVEKALKENTVFVSIGYVNNEIGTIQPIVEIAQVVNNHNLQVNKLKRYKLIFHTDAVQAANYLDINVKNLGVDLMTLSGHKIYGPKGVGILYKKEGVNLESIITGGGQERGFYSGTENVSAIVGFAEALKETEELKFKENERVKKLRNLFVEKVLNATGGVGLNGSKDKRVANNINFYFKTKTNEVLIPLFDKRGLYVSGGSACLSRTLEASHVISAIGRTKFAKSSIRFSFGRFTNEEDVNHATDIVLKLVQ